MTAFGAQLKIKTHHVAGLITVIGLAVVLCWSNRPWFATWIAEAQLPAARATYNLNDYAAFRNAARMIAAGEGPALYQIDAQGAEEVKDWGARYDPPLAVPYVNPPWFALALLPLAPLPVGAGFLIWLAVCLALVMGGTLILARWARAPPAVAAIFVLAPVGFVPFWRTLILGQTSALVFFGLALAVVGAAQGHSRRAGIGLALAGVKPQLLLLPVVALVAGRRWRTLAWAALTTAILLGAGLLVTGPGAIGDYLALLRSPNYTAYENLPQMQSWRALIEGTLGLGGPAALLLNGAAALAALAVVTWAWWPVARLAPGAARPAGERPRPQGVAAWGTYLRNQLAARPPQSLDPEWDLRMALTLLLTQMVTPHMHVHDLLLWLVPGGLILHHLYAGAPGTLRGRDRTAGLALLWAGYVVVWPAWLLPDARLALWFSLAAAAWLVIRLRTVQQERVARWAESPITP